MFARASLAVMFAVLVAMSRPVPSGGRHDLIAVGVRYAAVVDGEEVERTAFSVPTDDAVAAYDRMLRTGARGALLQGTTVYAVLPAKEEGEEAAGEAGDGIRILSMTYYGKGSRAARAPIVFRFEGSEPLPGAALAYDVAREAAARSSAATAASARVLLGEAEDAEAWRDALYALVQADPGTASAAARRAVDLPARPGAGNTLRRTHAVRALRRLGGAKVYPALFARLAGDDDPVVREAATAE